jgi:hypothetical protein
MPRSLLSALWKVARKSSKHLGRLAISGRRQTLHRAASCRSTAYAALLVGCPVEGVRMGSSKSSRKSSKQSGRDAAHERQYGSLQRHVGPLHAAQASDSDLHMGESRSSSKKSSKQCGRCFLCRCPAGRGKRKRASKKEQQTSQRERAVSAKHTRSCV